MADWQKMKKGALASVDAAIHIAERMPEPDDNRDINFSYDNTVNPFPFLLDLLRRFCGYNYMIKIIAKFISSYLPLVELAVKGALLANLKNLLYCTIDPRFKNSAVLRDGITFDLEDIDILHTLQYCPLNKNNLFGASNKNYGSSFYYGCDGFNYPSELVDAGDFNAFLWYVVNKSNKREVWRGTYPVTSFIQSEQVNSLVDSSLVQNLVQSDEISNYLKRAIFTQKPLEERIPNEKDVKGNGILTIIYYGDGMTTPRDITGAPVPNEIRRTGLLQVYIGNTTRKNINDGEFKNLERVYQQKCDDIFDLEKKLKEYKKDQKELENALLKNENADKVNEQKAKLESINKQIETTEQQLSQDRAVAETYAQQHEKLREKLAETYASSDYKDVTQNYYYDKTLMHFNYDMVMSMKLFDSKVIAAQLIEVLFNNLSGFNIHLSYQRRVIEEEVKKMVEKILETGSTTISDCFFAFSNQELDNLQRKVELQRAGLFSVNGESDTSSPVDIDTLFYNINNISFNATQQEVQTVIEGTLTNISKEFTSSETHTEVESDLKNPVKWDFINSLIQNLMTIIVEILCSPKVYLIYLINMKMLGNFDNKFNLEKFLQFKGELVAAVILRIRDIWADYLTMVFKDLAKDLEQMVRAKLINEQYEYFRRLLKQCLDCFKLNKKYLDFNLDDVDYADILSEEITNNENNGC